MTKRRWAIGAALVLLTAASIGNVLIGYGFDPATTPAGQEEQRARKACQSTITQPGFSNAGARLSPRPITVRRRAVAASGAPLGSVIAASDNLV